MHQPCAVRPQLYEEAWSTTIIKHKDLQTSDTGIIPQPGHGPVVARIANVAFQVARLVFSSFCKPRLLVFYVCLVLCCYLLCLCFPNHVCGPLGVQRGAQC